MGGEEVKFSGVRTVFVPFKRMAHLFPDAMQPQFRFGAEPGQL
jgi:hypothetical protein